MTSTYFANTNTKIKKFKGKSCSVQPQSGLYVVPTPIGNLSDITIRSLKILSSVDLIMSEDTRVTKKLTSKYGIKSKIQSFHKFNSKNKIPGIIKKISSNFSVAITTDSGTPLISDPGADLVKECFENNLSVFSLPGPSAPIASFVLATFQAENFTFRGFFPREKKKIESQLARFNRSDCPEIYFESPKRIIKTLNAILELSGDCKITFVRELTKKHEEIINTNISLNGQYQSIVSSGDGLWDITSSELNQMASDIQASFNL